MDEIIYKYLNKDPRIANYSDEEIQKAVRKIRTFIERLDSFRLEENGDKRRLSQVEEFAVIYDYVANRNYVEDKEKDGHAHSIVGVLNSGYSVCEGFTKLTQALCELRGIPFLYKEVITRNGPHGNFQVIVGDSNEIKHCLHCDPTIDCLFDPSLDPEIEPSEEKKFLTYNAFLVDTKRVDDYYKKQEPEPGSPGTSLFWKIAVDGQSCSELKDELENISDEQMFISMMMGQTKQDVVNSNYERIKSGFEEISKFLGVEISTPDTNEQVLKAYQRLLERYTELNIPLNREELFSTIQRVYSQNIPSKNINANLSERMDETQKNDRRYWDKEKNIKRDKLQRVVYTYAELAGVNEQEAIEGLIERLTNLNINDSIDTILVSLSGLLDRKALTEEQILSNSDLILALNPDKYKTPDDLIARLGWIKSMNMTHPQMPLTENHRLVIEVFDKLNGLIGAQLDSFYTGGLMGYLATNHQLERYHGDLDLFINENQLLQLYNLIQQSEDFEFESNMDHKEENGHEFKLVYKGTPMSVGLFLFDRLPNQEMVLKEYYYPNQERSNGLHVNERHLSGEYASMVFSNQIMEHNGIPYKTQSLDGIYHAKRDSRPKDKYDAQIVEIFVDMNIVHRLDTEKQGNYSVNDVLVSESIVEKLDEIIVQRKQLGEVNGEEQPVAHRR